MSGLLADTNVISELTRGTPDSRIVSLFAEHDGRWLCAIIVHEFNLAMHFFRQEIDVTEFAQCLSTQFRDMVTELRQCGRFGNKFAGFQDY